MVTRDPSAFAQKKTKGQSGEYSVIIGPAEAQGYTSELATGYYLNGGHRNTLVGNRAGGNISNGSYNTCFGHQAGVGGATYALSSMAQGNTLIGTQTGWTSVASGTYGTCVGGTAQFSGDYATAIGYDTTADAAGSVAIGTSSAGSGAATTVVNEIALGVAAHTVKTLGGRRKAIVAKTTTYAAAKTDHIINATSGTFTVTLPTAVSDTGREFVLKNSGTGVLTIATTSSQTIDGSTTRTLNQYDSLTVVSDGANWIII